MAAYAATQPQSPCSRSRLRVRIPALAFVLGLLVLVLVLGAAANATAANVTNTAAPPAPPTAPRNTTSPQTAPATAPPNSTSTPTAPASAPLASPAATTPKTTPRPWETPVADTCGDLVLSGSEICNFLLDGNYTRLRAAHQGRPAYRHHVSTVRWFTREPYSRLDLAPRAARGVCAPRILVAMAWLTAWLRAGRAPRSAARGFGAGGGVLRRGRCC